MSFYQGILQFFPQGVYPVILVSDPDGLLSDEALLSVLENRRFRIIQENDPVLLRYRIEQTKPFDVSKPILVITGGSLDDVPYDLWQQGEQVRLALHEFFPKLAYPIVRSLTSVQRARLSQIEGPKEHLGELKTIRFLLEYIFNFNSKLPQQSAHFVLWLDEFHRALAPFPPMILEYVLEQFRQSPEYQNWNLKELFQDKDAFYRFMQDQWQEFLSIQTGKAIGEKRGEYLLHFESNQGLQDALPRLLRNGSLSPVQMETQLPMPAWVMPGILKLDDDPRQHRVTELLASVNEILSGLTNDSRWEEWETLAYQWAELTILRNELGMTTFEKKDWYKETQRQLDFVFTDWLTQRYSPLAIRKLPVPHHVHHIPHYMNYLRTQKVVQKVALLIMDGMSLTDWFLLKRVWNSRQRDWRMKENLVLAQIPTITAVSRHSLVSGLRPTDFYIPNATKLTEIKAWSAFWTREGGLPENAISLFAVNLEKDDLIPEITNPRLQALCIIERKLDEIMHGTLLGDADHQATVELWLSDKHTYNSSRLEAIINDLLKSDFTVFISSDHGHCEASGIGSPAEGLMAQSRGKRARLYTDQHAAQQIQSNYENTILWGDDGLLPQNLTAILPVGRHAFTEFGEIVVTHGGITIDEMVVPLIEITSA